MFERNRIDNSDHGTLSVEITLLDGQEKPGKIVIPPGKTVFELLNGPTTFIDFEGFDGVRTYIAKAALCGVRLMAVPRAGNLHSRIKDLDGFDPHAVLGVEAGASSELIRQAYHGLAKTYHPDRYATASLPAEVKSYLAAMARRINLAHSVLEAAHTASKTVRPQASQPVYSSAPRR